MGGGRRPTAPYLGSWEHRREGIEQHEAARRAERERERQANGGGDWRSRERDRRPISERAGDLPYIPKIKPVQVSPGRFKESTQVRIHAFNVARAIIRNREHFPDELVEEAETLYEGAQQIGHGMEGNERVQFVDRGEPIFMAGGNIPKEELHERFLEYLGFVKKARKELFNAYKNRGVLLPQREIVDFWDPRQRSFVVDFVKKNAKTIQALLPTATPEERQQISALLTPFTSKGYVLNEKGMFYERGPRDATLEEYREGVAALEALRRSFDTKTILLEKQGLLEEANDFVKAFAKLKNSFMW